jgi:hypothetical protein
VQVPDPEWRTRPESAFIASERWRCYLSDQITGETGLAESANLSL